MGYKTDYWAQVMPRFSESHFRLVKTATAINAMSRGKNYDLLDVGCGPAALFRLLDKNINYYGIDAMLTERGPNLIEKDLMKNKIGFEDKSFDLICAFGFFEYMDGLQHEKLCEINEILKPGGMFLTSFVNFKHRHTLINQAYNNMISISDFLLDLKSVFHVERMYPTSYNWIGTEPRRRWMQTIQMPMKLNVPILKDSLAVQFIFICSKAK